MDTFVLWILLIILMFFLPVAALLVRFLIPIFALFIVTTIIVSCFSSKVRHWINT